MSKTGGSVGRLPAHELQESACRLTECHHAEIIGAFLILGVTVLTVVLAGVALSRLDEAREAIAAERDRASEELAAFEAFARRIRTLEPSQPRLSDGGVPLVDAGQGPDELAVVRQAYRETVMAVAHHDTEFGETLQEAIAAEFSPEVAAAVANGGQLTPGLHAALLRGASNACDRREQILRDLSDEQEAVDAATGTLGPAVETARTALEATDSATTPELVAEADRLAYHESRVEELLADRQTTIHSVEQERAAWYDYIYGELWSPHPVLSAGTATLDRLSAARDQIARRLASTSGE